MKIQNPILNAGVVPLIGASRYLLTLAALVALWWFDARSMNNGFDANLALIKSVGGAFDRSGKVEAALRAFSAEKMLLFAEISVVIWLVGKLLWWLCGLLFRKRTSAPTTAVSAAPASTEAQPPEPAADMRAVATVAATAAATKAPPPALGADAAGRLDARSGPSLNITENRTGLRAER